MPSWLRFALALVLASLALWFGTGLRPLWPLVWLAPLPVLLYAQSVGRGPAAALALLAWLMGGCNMWAFLQRLEVPPGPALASLALPAVAFAACVLLQRALVRRGAGLWAALGFAAGWVAFEYALAAVSPHGTYGNLAYTQMDLLALIQIASIGGPWPISFAVMLAPAAALASVHDRRALALVAAIAAALGWGWYRVNGPAETVAGLPVGLVVLAETTDAHPVPRDLGAAGRLQAYAAEAERLARDGARLIVLPEKIARLTDEGRARTLDLFAGAARRAAVTLVVGLQDSGPPRDRNVALVFAADGRLAGTYVKHHLIPHFEGENAPGTETLLLREPPGWGVQICKDLDFPALSRRYARAGARVMLVPAWDFVDDGWLHSRMAMLRGVEGGFSVVRAAREGLLTVSDDRGRVRWQAASGPSFTRSSLRVPIGSGGTLYSRLGDWFAWLCVVLATGALVRLWTLRGP